MARRWAREPLVHFLLAGAVMFVVTALWRGGGNDRSIRIDGEQLADYMQARALITDRNQFDTTFSAMSSEERAGLLRRAATDEALYREGLAIGLDKADPLIRQRIIQQMRQLLGDEAATASPLTDADVKAFYNAHRDDYRVGDSVSFAHVFFAERGKAEAELHTLRADKVPPEAAAAHGERFLYETFNRNATHEGVTARFGAGLADALFALQPGQWLGPLQSDHGWHLVYAIETVPGHVPTMEELGARLREDALAAKHEASEAAALEQMLGKYEVTTQGLPQ